MLFWALQQCLLLNWAADKYKDVEIEKMEGKGVVDVNP